MKFIKPKISPPHNLQLLAERPFFRKKGHAPFSQAKPSIQTFFTPTSSTIQKAEGAEEKKAPAAIGRWDIGQAFHHYSKDKPQGDFRVGGENWTTYYTNCRAEARAATGVPDDVSFVTSIKHNDAKAYIDVNQFATRPFTSIIYGKRVTADHFKNHSAIPEKLYTSRPLEVFTQTVNECSCILQSAVQGLTNVINPLF